MGYAAVVTDSDEDSDNYDHTGKHVHPHGHCQDHNHHNCTHNHSDSGYDHDRGSEVVKMMAVKVAMAMLKRLLMKTQPLMILLLMQTN